MNAIQSALACRRRSTWIRQASSSVGGTDRSLHCAIRMVNAAPQPPGRTYVVHRTRCKVRECSESVQEASKPLKSTNLMDFDGSAGGSDLPSEAPDRVIHERNGYRKSA